MFDKLGKFSSKYRYPIIVTWLVLVALVTLLAPDLGKMSISDQSGYLSAKSPSVVAAKLIAQYFPSQSTANSSVIVLQNANGSFEDPSAQAYLTELTTWLNNLNPKMVGPVMSPIDPKYTSQLISNNGQAAMLFVGLHASLEDTESAKALKDIQAKLDQAPAGFKGYITGAAAIANDYKNGAMKSAEKTTVITVVLVIAILLIIYRSPILPLVPLITIGIAYGIARGVVAWLATLGLTISSITDVFLVVLLFGAGTDYCLFIISRFREYMADDMPGPESSHQAIARVGETIVSSAGTVIVGEVAMSFVTLKLFSNTGPSLAIGVVIALLAGLTLTPALLAVLGRHAFWPGKPRHAGEATGWGKLANWVTTRPWVPLILAIVILVPLAIYGQGQRKTFDLLADIPNSVPSKAGFLLLSNNFGAGEMQPVNVLVTNITNARGPAGIAQIQTLTQQILKVEGVADVRSLTNPAGKRDPSLGDSLRVNKQLTLMADGIDSFLAQLDPSKTTNSSANSNSGLTDFTALQTYMTDLGSAFPDIKANADYDAVMTILGRLGEQYQAFAGRLLVSSQLAEVLSGINNANSQASGGNSSSAQDMTAMVGQLSTLQEYLTGLGQSLPAVTSLDGYADAVSALDEINKTVATLSEGLVLSKQLEMIAQEMDSMAQAIATNPLALKPQPGQPTAAEQMTALKGYLDELGAAFPALAATPDYQTAMDTTSQLTTSFGNTQDAAQMMEQAKQNLPVLSGAFKGLSVTAAQNMPEATFVPKTTLPGTSGVTDVTASLAKLTSSLERLQTAVVANLPGAIYIPTNISTAEVQQGMAGMLPDMEAFQAALRKLAESFAVRGDDYFAPVELATGSQREALTMLLDTYTTAKGDAALLQVILTDEPFSPGAMDTVARLRKQVSQAAIGGGSAVLSDLRDTMSRDTILMWVLVMGGITIVLILLLRSLVAPIYLVLTILLSYGATMGITRIVFDAILHRELTWFVPFFMFVMLMALGMDYNIFLMGRVKEEVGNNGTRAGVQRAVLRTGGIITSAGIIMAGTFAAMMSSSLIGLVQLAFAITVGVLLDTFVIRTTLVPAIVVLLDRWSWWPRNHLGK